MKKCNVCHCIVDEISECPICGNTITYEPPCMEDKERFVFSKYYFVYLLKNLWFSVLCIIISTVAFILSLPITSSLLHYLLIPAALMLIASFVFSLYKRELTRRLLWKYSKEYAVGRMVCDKYFYGITAVILCITVAIIN